MPPRRHDPAPVTPAPVGATPKPSGAMRLSKPSRPDGSGRSATTGPEQADAPTIEAVPAETRPEPRPENAAETGTEASAPAAPDDAAAPDAEPTDPDRRRVRLLTALGVVAVLLLAATTLLGVAWASARESGPTLNQAFVDGGGTSELVGQATSAIVAVYSYDYTTLPASEAAAKAVITGDFTAQFEKTFQPVKDGAVKEMTSVKTTVSAASVSQLQGDRARLLMMVDQTGTKGPAKQPTAASARLAVDMLRTDGRWKISGVTPE